MLPPFFTMRSHALPQQVHPLSQSAASGNRFIPLHCNGCARRLLPAAPVVPFQREAPRGIHDSFSPRLSSAGCFLWLPEITTCSFHRLTIYSLFYAGKCQMSSTIFQRFAVPATATPPGRENLSNLLLSWQHFPEILDPVAAHDPDNAFPGHPSLQQRRSQLRHMAVIHQRVRMIFHELQLRLRLIE